MTTTTYAMNGATTTIWNTPEAFTADDVLVVAGDEITRRGMTRWYLITPADEVCSLGALMAAYEHLSGRTYTYDSGFHGYGDSRFVIAQDACDLAVGVPNPNMPGEKTALWNNNEAVGVTDVVDMFEKARKILAEATA